MHMSVMKYVRFYIRDIEGVVNKTYEVYKVASSPSDSKEKPRALAFFREPPSP